MRGYPGFETLVATLRSFYAHASKPDVVTVEEIYALSDRDSAQVEKNKTWLRNRLTPLKYYRLIKPVYSSEGQLIEIELTQKGKEAIEGFRGNSLTEPLKAQTISPMNSTTTQLAQDTSSTPNRVLYPYPLLSGELIHISLPVKLSKDDAKRITIFIESIAVGSSVSTQEIKR
jgi:hypothetical protein